VRADPRARPHRRRPEHDRVRPDLDVVVQDDARADHRERPDVDAAELVGLWVAPAARGQGIGRQLVVEARDWVRSHGCARLTLWVADDNATARGLYAALGFRPTGETGAFPPPREHLREHEESLALPPHDHEDAPPS
jgi:ribosomal protein S18 acetylase RimI-like enzyme